MKLRNLILVISLVAFAPMNADAVSAICQSEHRAEDAVTQGFKRYSYAQLQMAMPLRITVWAESESRAQSACKCAFKRAAELVKVFSDYDDTSEVRRLLNGNIGDAQPVSGDLMTVLEFSQELCRKSNGAFNPTAGPVIRLWRTARRKALLPESSELAQRLDRIGFDKFVTASESRTVTLLSNETELDFGAVAKGYIGDQVIAELRKNGVHISYYKAGGDIVLGDAPPGSIGWQIDIGNDAQGQPKTMRLKNCAISISGDSEQFVDIGETRYSHVVDPRTGIGVTSGKTTFVIAPTGMHSDALATVGCILSETDFRSLLRQYDHTIGWFKEVSWMRKPIDSSTEQQTTSTTRNSNEQKRQHN